MNPSIIGILIFSSVSVSAILALRFRKVLPEHHLGDATKDTVKLTMGLVATMTALVLGLLVASTKASYDTEKGEITQIAATIIYLDRILVRYGPESGPARQMLRHTVENAIIRIWPDAKLKSAHARPDPSMSWSEALPVAIQDLTPQNDAQRAAKSEAARIAGDLGQLRWLLFEQMETSVSIPMLVVVVCWLAILFFSFALFAPVNGTAIGALVVAAASVAGAIFLILELDHPFDGFIRISSQPLQSSLAELAP